MKRLAVVLAAAGCLLWPSAPASAAQSPGVWDVNAVNHFRVSHGLSELPRRHDLRVRALDWSRRMARVNGLMDDLGGANACWSVGGTRFDVNVGVGPSVQVIQQYLQHSPQHRANLLGNWKWMGVAYTRDKRGFIWLTQEFCG